MKGPKPTRTGLTVRHPALRALLARWEAHRGAAPMPSRDDLRFINLLPWRGHVRRVEIDGDDLFHLLPCAHARIELPGEMLDHDYRRAVATSTPVRAVVHGAETLVLPFAGRGRHAGLLLVGSYAALSEDADESGNQKRDQRGTHEELSRRALEKA
jgi:hypothetical protein